MKVQQQIRKRGPFENWSRTKSTDQRGWPGLDHDRGSRAAAALPKKGAEAVGPQARTRGSRTVWPGAQQNPPFRSGTDATAALPFQQPFIGALAKATMGSRKSGQHPNNSERIL